MRGKTKDYNASKSTMSLVAGSKLFLLSVLSERVSNFVKVRGVPNIACYHLLK